MAESKTHDQLIDDIRASFADVEQGYTRFFVQGIKKGSVELRQALMAITRLSKDLRKVTMEKRKEMPNEKRVSPPRVEVDPARPELTPATPVKRKRTRKPKAVGFDSTELKAIAVK